MFPVLAFSPVSLNLAASLGSNNPSGAPPEPSVSAGDGNTGNVAGILGNRGGMSPNSGIEPGAEGLKSEDGRGSTGSVTYDGIGTSAIVGLTGIAYKS